MLKLLATVILASMLWSTSCYSTYRGSVSPGSRRTEIIPASKGLLLRSQLLPDDAGPFWIDGLRFSCTGCGRCCQTEGEVWLDTNEFRSLVSSLGLPPEDVLDIYAEDVIAGWVKLKSKEAIAVTAAANPIDQMETLSSTTTGEQCVFLDGEGKMCTIYASRPVQCRTYPYWPSIIDSEAAWSNEGVSSPADSISVRDDASSAEPAALKRLWTVEDGGCEGVDRFEYPLVSPITIHRNRQLYESYHGSFPHSKVGDDKQKLLSQVDVMQRVVRSTRQWVQDFVVGYQLCPFAERVFSTETVQYRVSLETDRTRIIERFKLEVLELMLRPEEEVATTLLMLPFAFPDFQQFHDFSLDLEDLVLPSVELHSRPPNHRSNNGDGDPSNEIQLAFFHPIFCWSDTSINDAVNFEKRAPFPTINLLRAYRIREYANQEKSSRISADNCIVLESVGGDALSTQFNGIIRLALE